MRIDEAGAADVLDLARLVHLDHLDEEPTREDLEAFGVELAEWWAVRGSSHRCFVARAPDGGGVVGMAWVAIVPRVPRPGVPDRLGADLQTVFVRPEWRGRGIGTALVRAAVEHAERLGVLHTTIHSGLRSVPVHERLGFGSSPQLLQRTAVSASPEHPLR